MNFLYGTQNACPHGTIKCYFNAVAFVSNIAGMKHGYLLFLILVTATGSTAQPPSVKWSYPVHDACFGQPAAADLDGDGKLEIVFSCYWNDSNVYVLNGQ